MAKKKETKAIRRGDREDSIRMAMDQAWRDHHHTRDQTWKALHAELIIAAGLIGINWQVGSTVVSLFSCILLCIVALCGMQITVRHRNHVEIRKFKHIMNCEEALGLHTAKLICDVKEPKPISYADIFCWKEKNTALFILRMHFTVFFISALFGIRTLGIWWLENLPELAGA